MPIGLTNDEKRLARISHLVEELRDKCTVDSDEARVRCKIIAIELVDLFRAEDIYRRSPDSSLIQRAEQAIREARLERQRIAEAREVMSLERMMIRTTRMEVRASTNDLAAKVRRLRELLERP